MSSTTGGTINIRKRWGKPDWSWGLLQRDYGADREKQLLREEKERLEMEETLSGQPRARGSGGGWSSLV